MGRMRAASSKIATRLSQLGADVIEGPIVSTANVNDHFPMDDAILNNHPARIWVFACEPSVDYFLSRLRALGKDIRTFSSPVVTIGDRVREKWASCGIQSQSHSHGLCEKDMQAHHSSLYDRAVVIPGPVQKMAGLHETLKQWAQNIHHIPCYHKVLKPFRILAPSPDFVVAPSSSCVTALCEMDFGINIKDLPFLTIGPKTTAAAKAQGIDRVIQSETDQIESLIQEILEFQSNRPSGDLHP